MNMHTSEVCLYLCVRPHNPLKLHYRSSFMWLWSLNLLRSYEHTDNNHKNKQNKSLKVQLFQCDLQKENSSSHCHIKEIQHMNSHFKSQNFEEGSKSQHNKQNQAFLMTRGSGNMRCRIENRHLTSFWKLKGKMKILGNMRWKKCPEELKITK